MGQRLITFYAMIASLLINQVHSEVTSGSYAQYCKTQGSLQITALQTTVLSPISFTYATHYLDSDKQSAPLYVNKVVNQNFKFSTVDKHGIPSQFWQCQSSASYTFVALIREFLFLKDGSNYYGCRWKITSTQTRNLVYSGSVVDYFPYLISTFQVDKITIEVIRVQSSKSIPLYWQWKLDTSVTIIEKVDRNMGIFDFPLTQAVGVFDCLYDKNTKKFYQPQYDTTTKTMRYQQSSKITGVLSTDTVVSHLLNFGQLAIYKSSVVITVTRQDEFQGQVYVIYFNLNGGYVEKQDVSTQRSTTKLKYFTDDLINFVRISSKQLFWFIFSPYSQGEFLKTICTKINDTENTKLDKVLNVALSKNRAIILYDDQTMEVYINTGNQIAERLFTKKPTQTMDLTDSSTAQYRIKVGCLCIGPIKSTCFAQTLQCLILREAKITCTGPGDTITSF